MSISWLEISGVSAQWRLGGHLISSEKENGADIPSGGWIYEDNDGERQYDETLTVKSILKRLMMIFTTCLKTKEASYQSTLTLCLRVF